MNWTDEEIDKLVQESAGAQQVEYKDAYWKEMEALLNQNTSKKSGFWWWMAGSALLLAGVGIYAMLRTTGNNQDQILISNAQSNKAKVDQKLYEPQNKTALTNNKNKVNSAVLLENSQVHISSELSTNEKSTYFKINQRSESNYLDIRGSQPNAVVHSSTVNNGAEKLSYSRVLKDSRETESIDEVQLQLIETVQPQLVANTLLPNEFIVRDLRLRTWQQPIDAQFEPTHGDLKVFPRTRLGFYIGLNGGIGQSYLATRTTNDMYQFGIDAGIEHFKGPWGFGVGLGIKQQFARNLELNDQRSYYSFGLVNVKSTLTYDQLIFADLNLNVSYSFGKSEVGVGITPNYLLGARLSYDQITQETIGYETQTIGEASVNHKYVSSKNFRQFGLNAGVNYSYALPRNYLIQLEVNSRVVGKLLKSTFEGKAVKSPLMIELGIKKRF